MTSALSPIQVPEKFREKLDNMVWPQLVKEDIVCSALTDSSRRGPTGEHKHCAVGWLNALAKQVKAYRPGVQHSYKPKPGTLRRFLFDEFAKQLTVLEGRRFTHENIHNWNDAQRFATERIVNQLNLLGERLGYTQPTEFVPNKDPVI